MTTIVNSLVSRRVRRILGASAALLASFQGVSAIAADSGSTNGSSDDGLQEITVTAERRVENERDVPISMTVFNADAIDQQNFQGIESYFDQTPNVSFISEGTRDRKELSLRGISDQLSPDNNIKEGSFGFYIDEFNVAQGTSNPEIVDIDRIEVLRGPQGTYFGRNSVGGAINITTKQPTNDFFAEGSSQYSSFNTIDSHVILNVPLIDNILAIRIAAQDETSDGNIKNINLIGGGNDSKYQYAKTILRFTPNDRLTIDLTGTLTNEHVGMRNGVPSGVLGDFSATALYGGPPYNGVAIPDGVGFYPNNTSRVNFNRTQDDGTKFNYVANRIKYDADAFTITNVLGYLYSNEFEGGDIDGSSLDLFYEQESIKRSSLSEELRIQSKPGGLIDWTGGVYYGHDIGHTTQYTFAGADNPFEFPPDTEVTSSLSDSGDLSYAAFGEAVWHIDKALALTVGARYTHEIVSNDSYNTSGDVSGLNYVNGSASFNNFSPRATLLYTLSDETNLYATISRGFKAGGITAQPAGSGGNDVYKPETLTNYEFGVKSESADHRLRLDADVFYMDWKDIQSDFSVGQTVPGGGVDFITGTGNAAGARSYGFETEASALIVTGLTVGAGAGYDRAYYTRYTNAETGIGTEGDLSGVTLPNAPLWTLHANTQYKRNFYQDYSGFARLEWFYRGGIVPDQNSEFHTGFPWDVPKYDVWNLRLGINKDTWSVNAFVENLFDKKYYTNAYEKAFVTGMFIEPSYRNAGVRFTIKTH